jgi:hypothetical protein
MMRGQATRRAAPETERGRMNKELFGVFGDRDAFTDFRDEAEFHTVVEGESVTVGVRDPALGVADRTAVAESDRGVCVVWGEAFTPTTAEADPAAWLLENHVVGNDEALDRLNGSYLAVVEVDGDALVATDPLRSWECFYTDAPGIRAFGTDASIFRGLLGDPAPDRTAVLEFLHLGTVLGERTLFESLERVPFDGYLRAASVGEFDRFVYDPQPGDHAAVLADRLGRAIDRRAGYPGRKGLLLSAGQDSRTILAGEPDITECYTVGAPDSQEVEVARRIADQFDAEHTVLAPAARYLGDVDCKVPYTQGLRESLHVHHGGYDDELEADTMYHGLLYDTLLKGYFLEWDSKSVLGVEVPQRQLVDDPQPVAELIDTLGFMPEGSDRLADRVAGLFPDLDLDLEDPRAFIADRLRAELAAGQSRVDSVHNAMDLLVLRNQPVMHFRTQLADNYLESFVAIDRELLQWHLETPPEHRHYGTVADALAMMDDRLLEHRPPGRPHRIELLNQIERFARRKLPLVGPIEPAWPDRETLYEEHDLDETFFPDDRAVRALPARQKLRANDLRWWLP